MTKEEKKAVGLLKALNNLEKKCKVEKVPYKSEIKKISISLLPEDYGIFEILLNLIEKLQKENEELHKEINERIKLKIENEKIVDTQFLPIQKVKDKIEEIQKDKDNKYYDMFLETRDIDNTIKVLRELLEGRK